MEDNEEDLRNITSDEEHGRTSDCPYQIATAMA
jgi:hypothetical protein